MLKVKIAKLKEQLSFGVTPAMATPLADDGYTVNTAVIPQLVDFLLARGVAGLFVGGTTGEGILLAVTERMRLHEAALQAANGRVPVILHTGANQLQEAVALAQHAAELEAAAIAAVTPYFYGMHDDSLAAYYQAIATAAPQMPLLLYDIPHLSVNGVSPALLARLGEQLPALAGVKTSRADAQVVRRLIDAAPTHTLVLAGNEAIALGSLALGANGLISGLSTAVPEPFVALTRAVRDGNLTEARRCQLAVNQMLAQLPGGARIGAIKQILVERGVPVGAPVPPRPTAEPGVWIRLRPFWEMH